MELNPTRCPICNTEDGSQELFPANFDPTALNPEKFSARRLPDRIHFRIVRCKLCKLVRSDPVADSKLLSELYTRSDFTYMDQTQDLNTTYGRYLDRLEEHNGGKDRLLEIGCGNGFFLSQALKRGYREVRGVEPSTSAVAQAATDLQPHIVCDIMRPGLFAPASFDVICLFQVFDHIPDPGALLDECHTLLKTDGHLLFIHHNIEAFSSRLLGRLSPIIDLEHTFLYSPTTMAMLCEQHGFSTAESGIVLNTYSLSYLARLLPLPTRIKTTTLSLLAKTSIGKIRVRVPLGNLLFITRKEKL